MGSIIPELHVFVVGEDTMNLDISLGDIVKCEVSFETLREQLKNMRVDTNHPLIVESFTKCPKSTLCVVTGTLSTKKDAQLNKDETVKVNTEASCLDFYCLET